MNRAGFIKRALGFTIGMSVADRIAALEQWHATYPSGVALAADRPATLATLDAILREYYLPPIREQLNRECLHRCGSRYTVGWLERDGRVLRWIEGSDAWEATLYTRCDRCLKAWGKWSQKDVFHYARIRITGNQVFASGGFLVALKTTLDAAVQDLIRHLHGYGPWFIGPRRVSLTA